jgi:hypothetical protein
VGGGFAPGQPQDPVLRFAREFHEYLGTNDKVFARTSRLSFSDAQVPSLGSYQYLTGP